MATSQRPQAPDRAESRGEAPARALAGSRPHRTDRGPRPACRSHLSRSHVKGDRRLAAQALLALVLASARYWTSIAIHVRRCLRHWEQRARAVDDPELRELALSKLAAEGFNAEAAAMAATLAARAHRRDAIEAIVALQLQFDYLDGLTERPHEDPIGEGERLHRPFVDVFDPRSAPCERSRSEHVYLHELGDAAGAAIARLPGRDAIAHVARRCAQRAATAQVRMHAAAELGTEQLTAWAALQAQDGELAWRELLAGSASSVLTLHALIAAATDPRVTPEDAEAIERAYLWIGAVVTLLDGLVDHGHDSHAGCRPTYISFYERPELLAATLTRAAREGSRRARALPSGAHHVMTLAGAIAYNASSPGARSEIARPVLAQLRRDLPPFVSPALLVMRTWRAGKLAGARWRGLLAGADATGAGIRQTAR